MSSKTRNVVLPEVISVEAEEEIRPELECKHIFLPVIIILMLFGTIIVSLADTQYGYYAFQMRMNISSDVSSSKQSLCEVNTSTTSYRRQQEIQSQTAVWNAYCHIAQSVPVLVMAMMVGSWSDQIGRKASLYIPTFGILFKAAFFALGITFNWDIYTFVIPFFVDGLCGTWISLVSAAYSYAADLTQAGKSRLFGVMVVEAILGFGVVIGTFASGFVFKYLGFLYGSVLVTGICILNCICIFFLQESVTSTSTISSISQFQYFKNAIYFYIKKDPLRWRYQILGLAFAFTVLPNIGRVNVQSLFVMNSPFCWNSVYIGYFGAERAGVQMVVGVGLAPLFYKFMSKNMMAVIGTLSQIGYYILSAVATNGLMIFLTPVVGILGFFPPIVLRALLSMLTPQHRQGAMFGSLAAIDAVCSLVGSVTANLLYSETVHIFRGLIMLVFAFAHFIALILFGLYILKDKKEKENSLSLEETGENEETSKSKIRLTYIQKI